MLDGCYAGLQKWLPDFFLSAIRLPLLNKYDTKLSFYLKSDDPNVCEMSRRIPWLAAIKSHSRPFPKQLTLELAWHSQMLPWFCVQTSDPCYSMNSIYWHSFHGNGKNYVERWTISTVFWNDNSVVNDQSPIGMGQWDTDKTVTSLKGTVFHGYPVHVFLLSMIH